MSKKKSSSNAGAGRPLSEKSKFARGVTPNGVKEGAPDMYNHVPIRPVSIEEAKSHGWSHFWDGDAAPTCPRGHKAARYVINPSMCTDCNRENMGKSGIYPKIEGSDLTAPSPAYVEPIANRNFEWTSEKREQFFTAYVNTCSVLEALRAISAQMSHLIKIRKEDSAFRERMDRLEDTDIRQAQFYRAEHAALENDRMQQLQAQRKFPDSFGSGAQAGLGRAEAGSPEQIDAEFAQLLQRAGGAGGAKTEVAVAVPANGSGRPEPSVVEVGKGSDLVAPTSGGVPAPDDPNSDLVS